MGIKVESAKEMRPPTILRISERRKLLTLAKDGSKVETPEICRIFADRFNHCGA
ncbi:MAG TPA: hypothetical protein VIS99_00085 [Terrimicrobiaceae bacterium]